MTCIITWEYCVSTLHTIYLYIRCIHSHAVTAWIVYIRDDFLSNYRTWVCNVVMLIAFHTWPQCKSHVLLLLVTKVKITARSRSYKWGSQGQIGYPQSDNAGIDRAYIFWHNTSIPGDGMKAKKVQWRSNQGQITSRLCIGVKMMS